MSSTSAKSVLSEEHVDALDRVYGTINPATRRRWSLRELETYARETLGVEVSREAIRRAIKPRREERAALAREITRKKIQRRLPRQVDDLDTLMSVVRDLILSPKGKKPSTKVVLEGLDTFRKSIETKLKFSGVGERVEVEADVHVEADVKVTDARDELAAVLAREAAGAPRPGPPGGPGAAQP